MNTPAAHLKSTLHSMETKRRIEAEDPGHYSRIAKEYAAREDPEHRRLRGIKSGIGVKKAFAKKTKEEFDVI